MYHTYRCYNYWILPQNLLRDRLHAACSCHSGHVIVCKTRNGRQNHVEGDQVKHAAYVMRSTSSEKSDGTKRKRSASGSGAASTEES